MVVHHRLENALARAEELIAVGNQSAALQLLHEAIVSRWFQHNLLALDAIMLKFVELCVELRRGRLAKDGLHQYRSVSQNVNVAGMETVMKHFLVTAEEKLEAAAASAASAELVEDLEQAPEETLASVWGTTLGGDEKERSGRETVTPWLRFVWEAYRIILDICRHNAKLEQLYRDIVERAFAFCRRYGRKAEFRRLCEILRHHLGIIIKYPGQANGIALSEEESHQLQLELRFEQLAVATEMELWHEAFRSIEDIHGLFVLARKSAKPTLVMTYYERLCRVFQMSNNYLYLAATLCKLFALAKAQGAVDPKRMRTDATLAVLAIIASPLLHERDVTNTMTPEEVEAKNTRLAYFLGLQKAPTRSSVLRELHTREILTQADEGVQKLFQLVECSNNSINKDAMGSLLAQLGSVNEQYSAFVPSIYKNVVARIFTLISGVENGKRTIAFTELSEMISMPQVAVSEFDLSAFILEGCRSGDFHVKIDHRQGTVRFEKPCFASQPTIEYNDALKDRSVQLLMALKELVPTKMEEKARNNPILLAMAERACGRLEEEHRANLARKKLIERKREMLDELQQRREREEARERAVKQQQEREAEAKRLADETAKREAQRREVEREEIRRDQAAKREEEEQRKKEALVRRANLEKMIAVVKRLDHLERAFRQEEMPLLKDDYERQKTEDRIAHEERCVAIKTKAKSQHEADVQMKQSLASMMDDYRSYLEGLKARRAVQLEAQKKIAEAELEKAKTALREKALAKAESKRQAEESRRKYEEEQAQRQLYESEEAAKAEIAAAPAKGAYVPPGKRATTSSFGSRATETAPASGGWRRGA
jgi:translation initiation factor 3 subunit A